MRQNCSSYIYDKLIVFLLNGMAKSEHELQSIVFNTFSVSYDHAVFGEFQTVPVSLTGSFSAVSLRCSFTSVQFHFGAVSLRCRWR